MKSSKEKILILIRHAHRDKTNRSLDNGLDQKGKEQARRIYNEFKRTYSDISPILISSPMKRCIETVHPLASLYQTEITLDSRLKERGENESSKDFKRRVNDFLNYWKTTLYSPNGSAMVICSHSGWLPLAMSLLVGTPAHFAKGSWAEVSMIADHLTLKYRN